MTSSSDKSRNISLIIGLSIPVAMILLIAIAINGPRWFNRIAPPEIDFLYLSGQQTPNNTYLVKDGELTLQEYIVPEGGVEPAKNPLHFFLHDVSENKSKEIELDDALQLMLDGSLRSPDGFSVENGRRGGGWFMFGYRGSSQYQYLVNESYSDKLNLETQNGRYNYYWNFRFLGWVKTGE